ncbi:MAG: T9SS type A sorting domain-containing protein [Flavobacteriales bacterium]|nr:T9SS type A sorting domain-containing protein [Flavobacteriales bacterium]
MRFLSTLLVAILLCSSLYSQKLCGFDPLMEMLHTHEGDQQQLIDMNYQILERSLQLSDAERDGEYVIPCVVHVIHENGPENLSDLQIETAIEHLNAAFANEEGPFGNPDGIPVPIRFCLAGTDPNGEFTTGINRVEDPLTDMLVPSQDLDLKDLSRWNPEQYLNIWLVKQITREENNSGVVGYATFPDAHGMDIDGIVCEAEFFGTPQEDYSKVHIHEIGHYLGLYHTFQDLCPNDDCQTSGDWVCDTPPDQVGFNYFCYDGTNSCTTDEDDTSENNPFRAVELGGLGDQLDEADNYMDYTNLYCFNQFTQGQSDRMVAALLEVRSSLLDGDRCSTPCETPFPAEILAGSTELEVGDNEPFVLDATDFTGINWYIDNEFVSDETTFIFDASAEGEFELAAEVFNDEPGCTQEFEYLITVTCGVSAVFSGEGGTWPVGTTLEFVNDSEGVTEYTWTINGEEVGSEATLNYTFDQGGVFTIQLDVTNGLCIDAYVLNVAIGNCATGREANVWYFQNSSENFFGLDFNPGEDFLIEEQPPLPGPLGHNKSTFCDGAGNLMYSTNGEAIFDPEGNEIQNGGGLLSNQSSHWGSVFIRKPGSDTEIYLFTCDSEENNFANGIRYHVIDETLNGGLGGVIEGQKNILIETNDWESITTIRHCNLVDFWVAFYDGEDNTIKSYLVNENGVADTPVVSDVPVFPIDQGYIYPLKANGPGDLLLQGPAVYNFDPSTGEAEHVFTFDTELVFSYALSLSGTKAYFQIGDIFIDLFQADLSLPLDQWQESLTVIDELSATDLGIGMSLGSDGKIYQEETFGGWLSIIENPDAPANEVIFNDNAEFIEGTVNGFANFHHGYIYGPQLFVEGEETVCAGVTESYNVFAPDCVTSPITWSIEGDASFMETAPGMVDVTFNSEGEIALVAEVELFCGAIIDTTYISVGAAIDLDLGPDMSLCADGSTVTRDAGPGFESYEWQDGSEEQTFEVNATGIYTCTVSNGVCEVTDEIAFEAFIDPVIDLGPDQDICEEAIVLNAGNDFLDYVWQDGWTGPTYTVYEAGTYWVTTSTPCFATDTVVVTDCGIIINNIGEQLASLDLLSPNPVSQHLNVSLGTPADFIRIHDTQGRLVFEESVNSRTQLTVDLASLAPGIYSVTIGDGEERRVHRVVKE